ncbi:transglutaminase family protein [Sphingomonas sanguinis]|uniref:Transglutaminase family protein n=1 Tax=Sphingomonas sanguinis TaxID=33051 RepID=A0ABU5LN16_9SPHN|nr:transglutaminase family protein [Sphingomonas sanguinis]MDZ7281327.1 transglutaminase family protein [Sphingomonas sanguinis]
MRLHILHQTRYLYRREVHLQPHRLMLTPRDAHELRVLSRSLHCSSGGVIGWAQDMFGNLVATATFNMMADSLVIINELVVEQSAPLWPIIPIAPSAHQYPFHYSPAELFDLAPMRSSNDSDDHGRLDTWAHGFIRGSSTDTLALLNDINIGVADTIGYRTRNDEGTQTPMETLALSTGSCRDLAALFIEAVRRLGFAARAVSGYLFDPDADSSAAGATHAWAEVYLPMAGWIAFDPTQRHMGSAHLVPVATGRCNEQIMPVTGGYVGAAEDAVGMTVEVTVHHIGQNPSDL